MNLRIYCTPFFLTTLLIPLHAAADGRIEINQAIVEEAGGFPYEINTAGNYVLTSDLTVPADTTGIDITANANVRLDLNGFIISGPFMCRPGSCTPGSALGIISSAPGLRFSIRGNGGGVSGFSNDCVNLGLESEVMGLSINNCGQEGLEIGARSIVEGNRVSSTGVNGILMGDGSTYGGNVVFNAARLGQGFAISGPGHANRGNSCDDASCSSDGRKRYYLTNEVFNGSEPLGACSDGFHMASLYEIVDTSSLMYDTTRGVTLDDSGSGPPKVAEAWIRTGFNSEPLGNVGILNCSSWTVTSGGGTKAALDLNWIDITGDIPRFQGWSFEGDDCMNENRVWCVED